MKNIALRYESAKPFEEQVALRLMQDDPTTVSVYCNGAELIASKDYVAIDGKVHFVKGVEDGDVIILQKRTTNSFRSESFVI